MQALKTNRSEARGPDNISAKQLARVDKPLLVSLFNAIFHLGYLPAELRRNKTILIPKSAEDRKQVNNWRPITISSIIMRILNKIIAARLATIDINPTQMGFVNADGTLINNSILQNVIRGHRSKAKPYTIIALDLQKAFDSVSHLSIMRATRRFGIPDVFIDFITANYHNISTVVECGGLSTKEIPVRRGVKQGDPLSPILFNLIMDELLSEIDNNLGLEIDRNTRVAALAYADDLLLMAPGRVEANILLKTCIRFFDRRGLQLNTKKCAAVVVRAIPKKKKLYAVTSSTLNIKGIPIPAKGVEFFKYLGLKYNMSGNNPPTLSTLEAQLHHIRRSPLKPNQKYNLITKFLVPKWIHHFQNPKITKRLLQNADKLCREAVRRVLHLPTHIHNAYLHAAMADGGLGLFNFSANIPRIMSNRLTKICCNTIAAPPGTVSSALCLQRKLSRFFEGEVPTARKVRSDFATRLQQSYSGNGIGHAGFHPGCSSWIVDGPTNWTGATYIKAIQLRGNVLPTKGHAGNRSNNRFCRSGCGKIESLSHVLQGCHVTHHQRIRRHDRAVALLAKWGREAGWEVWKERRLALGDGTSLFPDLIFAKDNNVIISDVGINWEGPRPLEHAYRVKEMKYNTEAVAEATRRSIGVEAISSFKVLPFILGARGTYCAKNDAFFKFTGIPIRQGTKAIRDAIVGSISIHTHYNRAVWAN